MLNATSRTARSAPATDARWLRDGVAPSEVVIPTTRELIVATPTLLDYFAIRFPRVPRQTWELRFLREEVWIAPHRQSRNVTARTVRGNELTALHSGVRLCYYRGQLAEPISLESERVLFEDERILVADKPHGMPVIPSGRYVRETLLSRLRARSGLSELAPAHRIDRDTAGLVLFTKAARYRTAYQSLFRDRIVTKTYEAIAPFRPAFTTTFCYRSRLADSAHFMQVETVAGEPNAITEISLLRRLDDEWALYELRPITGHRHQLRAQLAHLGIAIQNDPIYPTLLPEDGIDGPYARAPLKLLAKCLEFVDPIDGDARQFESTRELVASQ